MSIKSVVKVMNFHSLLRVDKSRELAKRYTAMEAVLTDMIDNIVNNRNVVLDIDTLRVKSGMPVLNIYIGSDMGFCNNINSLVRRELEAAGSNVRQVIIGRKLKTHSGDENVILFQTQEEYEEDHSKVMDILEDAIRGLKYSQINIVYNHYYNSAEVDLVTKQIFPITASKRREPVDERTEKFRKKNLYNEDFTCEGDFDRLLVEMVILYLQYSMEVATAASYAAENIARQNVTTESLKKIDEREEIQKQQERRAEKDKQFSKVLDNFTKLKAY